MSSSLLRSQLEASLAGERLVAEHLVADAAHLISRAALLLDRACRSREVEPQVNAIPGIDQLEAISSHLSAIVDPPS
jgi:hypothetical protein